MTAFDTSALIPLFDTSNPHHERANQAFRDAQSVLLHPVVVAEAAAVLRRNAQASGRQGNAVARQALEHLRREPRCRVVSQVNDAGALERYLSDGRLSLVDSYVIQVALQHGNEPPVTFDDDLVRAWKVASKKAGQPKAK